MNFYHNTAEIYIPDSLPVAAALARTTHLCIAAHQDDIEIMAAAPIIECFQRPDRWFTGVVVSDGRGAPRDGIYKNYTDDQMHLTRKKEQKKAALIGEYTAQILLDYPSKTIMDGSQPDLVSDLVKILLAARPKIVYTHNLADKHDSHVAVALRVIAAIRQLPADKWPAKLYGCEVWRGLDWIQDSEKVCFDTSAHEGLQVALLGVFDSQIAGGKRYDLAAMGRRRANATFFQSHGVDRSQGLIYGMDMTPLITDPNLDPVAFTLEFIQRFADDVADRLRCMGASFENYLTATQNP